MADFAPAFDKMLRNEGGYRLINVAGDRGGRTYAGIAQKFNPDWKGWSYIDRGDLASADLARLVSDFYKANYWDRVRGDGIVSQSVAETLFDFGVNAGVVTAAKLAQIVIGAQPDGVVGPATLASLNAQDERTFILKYALAKVARYAEICNRDQAQSKFLLGWINRTVKGIA